MDIYRCKCPINNCVATINIQSKRSISSLSKAIDLERDVEYWRRQKYNQIRVLYEDGYAYYHCKYVIGPFLLCMYLMHDFKKQITYINQFKLFHQHLNISISKVILIISEQHINTKQSKYEINIVVTNKQNTIRINRRIELTITVSLNDVLDELNLKVHIDKASSILHNTVFEINNIFNNYDILKYLLRDMLCFFPEDIIEIICNQFLSKYFWIFPSPFMHHSLALHRNMTERLPFQYQMYYGYRHGTPIEKQEMIESVKYVGYHNLNQSQSCNINGISVQIEIDDKKIVNAIKYSQLFNIFSKYDISEPELSTILPLKNPSALYKLKNLYEELERYCADKLHLIRINAKLLIDGNIESNDIAMLWINWKSLDEDSQSDHNRADDAWFNQWKLAETQSTHCIQSESASITPTHQLAISLLIYDATEYEKTEQYIQAADVYKKLMDLFTLYELENEPRKYLHKMAQMCCHFNVDKSVECYQRLMEITNDYTDIIYGDEEHHCGEPMIAMERIQNKNEQMIKEILNEKKKEHQIIIDKYTKRIKKMRKKNKLENMRNNTYRIRKRCGKRCCNRMTYHRW